MLFFPDIIPTSIQYAITTCGILFFTAATALYAFQCNLIYVANYPPGSRQIVSTPPEFGIKEYEDVTLTTKDGVRIRAYVCKQTPDDTARKSPTILLLHANAGNMGHRLPIAKKFYDKYKYNVVLLSYRGYGFSEGTANEEGIRIDAQTMLNYIKNEKILKDTKLIVYGQSIGGAVAVDLISRNENQVDALIIENTFLSIPKLVPHVLPQLRHFTFLCHQIWSSEESIKQIAHTPILFLVGSHDELVPPSHMRELFKLTQTSGKKEWKEFPHGSHNDTVLQPGYFEVIAEFIEDEVVNKDRKHE